MPRLASSLIIFVASAVVLLLEILAVRLLAPYLGVSLETYSAIIGVVLAGIALGSWWGGRLADRVGARRALGPLLLAGGALTLLTVPIVRGLGTLHLGDSGLAVVVFTLLAFLAPTAVLSAVSPAVVTLHLERLEETGRTVGRLSALATIGALCGTFLTGFVFVRTLPTRPIITGAGVFLVLLGALAWQRGGGAKLAATSVLLAVLGGALTWWVPQPCDVESGYFCAKVESSPSSNVKTLLLDGLRHASVDPAELTRFELEYPRDIAGALSSRPAGPLEGLFIGGGGFHLPRWVVQARPGSKVRVLELDPALVELAHEKLGLARPPPFSLAHGDARRLIHAEPKGSYQFVVGDAFGSQAVPWHLTTREFLGEVRGLLRPGGVYVVNVIDAPPLKFARAELRTMRGVFKHVALIADAEITAATNVILVGSDEELDAGALTDGIRSHRSTSVVLSTQASLDVWMGEAEELTDDFAPVDQLLTVN